MKKWKNITGILALALFLSLCTSEAGHAQNNTKAAALNSLARISKTVAVESQIQFSDFDKNIFQGEAHTINLLNVPANYNVTFESTNPSILEVVQTSNTGCRYTGIGYGSAKIVAKISKNGILFFDPSGTTKTLQAKFCVSPRAVSVKFRKTTKKMKAGENVKLHLTIRPSISREVPVFQTQNRRIATINTKGVVTAIKSGKTYVTATLANGKSARCKIIVRRTSTSAEPVIQAGKK